MEGQLPRTADGIHWWHVFNRRVMQLELFTNRQEEEHFLELAADVFLKHEIKVLAYDLVGTHFHFVVAADRETLSRSMFSLQQRYARYINLSRNLSGRAFQGPFRRHELRSPMRLARALLYVDANATVAGMFENPMHDPNSSFAANVRAGAARPFHVTSWPFSVFSNVPDPVQEYAARMEAYLRVARMTPFSDPGRMAIYQDIETLIEGVETLPPPPGWNVEPRAFAAFLLRRRRNVAIRSIAKALSMSRQALARSIAKISKLGRRCPRIRDYVGRALVLSDTLV